MIKVSFKPTNFTKRNFKSQKIIKKKFQINRPGNDSKLPLLQITPGSQQTW